MIISQREMDHLRQYIGHINLSCLKKKTAKLGCIPNLAVMLVQNYFVVTLPIVSP